MQGYIEKLPQLKAAGVDEVLFISYNDAWVMSAWGKANGVKGEIVRVSPLLLPTSFRTELVLDLIINH